MAEIKAEKMATRQAYGKTLVELGKTTPHLVDRRCNRTFRQTSMCKYFRYVCSRQSF